MSPDGPTDQPGVRELRLARHGESAGKVAASAAERARVEQIAIAREQAGVGMTARVGERLRDRQLGFLDPLTSWGVERRHPDEYARGRHLGKFSQRR
ncbi:MAG: hypothetical protein LH605_08115 [Microbacteriaceae bacterium]|nr:hypothetical protein [Microbacteriaceae bacterium]